MGTLESSRLSWVQPQLFPIQPFLAIVFLHNSNDSALSSGLRIARGGGVFRGQFAERSLRD